MPRRYIPELLLLAALWGASFLFMRVSAPAFGPVPLIALRVAVAALVLLPVLAWRGQLPQLRQHVKPLAVVGLANSALPFTLFAFATLYLTAGLTAILNSTAPFWTALVAFALWGEKLSGQRLLGIAIGFAGVVILVWHKLAAVDALWAIGACLLASLCYGFAANYSKHKLAGVPPLVSTVGSQIAAALMLLPLTYFYWPAGPIGTQAWLAAIALGVLCTGIAYLLFFRLIAHVGAGNAVMVTFLIPIFGNLWGALFLGEHLTLTLLAGGTVILLGIAFSLGVIRKKAPTPQPAAD
ncbi:DMT family transporter [Gallaecimonas kandeliae]|uniref:DMT family transporter n=1 Tax=Gallaecimonas kandeliae TaxID=3029055 RepID=UPI0026493D39|nr:DMT family transporter [Gallaecimonas kandeliae]WKE65362.1 DMT family transporter [Gallaecimonas kandeliae]